MSGYIERLYDSFASGSSSSRVDVEVFKCFVSVQLLHGVSVAACYADRAVCLSVCLSDTLRSIVSKRRKLGLCNLHCLLASDSSIIILRVSEIRNGSPRSRALNERG